MPLHSMTMKGKTLTTKYLFVLIASIFLVSTAGAADKIRIGFPEFNSSTFTLPLAQIKGFFNEEGLQAELIRLRSGHVLDF